MLQVGECYWIQTDTVFCDDPKRKLRPKVKARVVYVHPKGRYATLEFSEGLRECCYPEELTEKNRA